MSIVRYVNKETGRVAVYESTSYYDPVKKQSRPIRKYLGMEDPVTGELIPSSKTRGRKKQSTALEGNTEPPITAKEYQGCLDALQHKQGEIDTLRQEITRLNRELRELRQQMKRIALLSEPYLKD